MATAQTDGPTPRKPLRLWPGVVAVVLQWLVWFVVPLVAPLPVIVSVFGGLLCGLAVVVWWVFFSRAPWAERLGVVALMIVAALATSRLLHESIAKGLMGMMFPVYAIPVLCLAFVASAVASHRFSIGRRRMSMTAAILLGCGVFTLLRTGGITGDVGSDFRWRWTQSPEERLLSQASDEPVALSTARAAAEPPKPVTPQAGREPAAQPPGAETSQERLEDPTGNQPATLPPTPTIAKKGADWPGFRGTGRDGVVRGVPIKTDWMTSPPVQLWRRPIGPGWSSFAVRGDLLYTQEQRGDDEIVACYKVATGEPVWRHRDAARFWESNGGAGPRGTPTLSGRRVYTLGATGILNALDAASGAMVWSRNVAIDTATKIPGWGFASSPLVAGDVVIVAAAGTLAAYDAATGDQRWLGRHNDGEGYSSPHPITLDGGQQILFVSGQGAIGVTPADGTLLWEHAWPGVAIVQPAQIADGGFLISTAAASGGIGVRRLAVAHGPGGWAVEERWTSAGLKPYFNDFVVHKGHAFGFDGSILACIDLENGNRRWKGGRYGNGQLVLLPDQDLLLVLSEEGELALVAATPDKFTELARVPAIEGKTWNHPVLVDDVLLVRNGEEMAAFRLPLAR